MKILLILLIVFFLSGCAVNHFTKQLNDIEIAYKEGKITKEQELKLKNELINSAEQTNNGAVVFVQPTKY